MSGATAVSARRDLRVVLVAGSVIAAIGLGVRSTFGLYLGDMTSALGVESATFALAIGIQNLVWGIGQPVAGAIADRYGSGRVLSVGAVLYCVGVLAMAGSSSALGLHVSGGFVVGVGLAATSFSVVLASIGRRYPPERRSQALGITTAIGSGGQFVMVQVSNTVEGVAGWRTSLGVLGLLTLAIVVLARPLRGRADDVAATTTAGDGPSPTVESLRSVLGRAGTNRSYLLLCAGFFVCGFHVTFIATHLIPYLEGQGVSTGVAGLAWGLVGLANIAGSYLAGVLGSRHRKTHLLSAIYAARGVVITTFVLLPATTVTVIAFGAAIGVLWLSTVPPTGAIVAQQFGTRHAGTLFGIVFLSHQVGAFAGAWGGGWLSDRTGAYDAAWWIAVGLAAAATVVHLFIDEGPQPVAPRRPTGRVPLRRLGPATGLAALAAFATLTLGAGRRPAAAATTAAPIFCVAHPVLPDLPAGGPHRERG